ANVGLWDMVWMRLTRVDYVQIVNQKIALTQAGVEVSNRELVKHVLSGGNVDNVARAVIAARNANLDLSWKVAATIDLAGRDIFKAVQDSVTPKVIDCPSREKGTLEGVCRNGIQLRVRARVTVRTKLNQLVGGAMEDTIIARVGEGIVKAIGS